MLRMVSTTSVERSTPRVDPLHILVGGDKLFPLPETEDPFGQKPLMESCPVEISVLKTKLRPAKMGL